MEKTIVLGKKKRVKTVTQHEAIFKSYPLAKIRDIIKKSNIALTGKNKKELVASMLKRRRMFNWLEKYNKTDDYKKHPKYQARSDEKEAEEEKRDTKSNQKVRKFKGGGRTSAIARTKDRNKVAMKQPTYKTVEVGGATGYHFGGYLDLSPE